MIITRTPLRISIGGGGTDVPSYYKAHGGTVISAAIDRYVYITLHETFQRKFIIKYSQLELVDEVGQIQHPIVREAFRMHSMPAQIEMVSMADIPAGTGLGSSGAFNVGLLKAVHQYKGLLRTTQELAEEACRIEIDLLKEPIGKQDQYAAAFGGMIRMEFAKDGAVTVTPLNVPRDAMYDLEDNLLLFFTGYSRSASGVLSDQKTRTESQDPSMIENLHFIRELGVEIGNALEKGNTRRFGELMHVHWEKKKTRSGAISNPEINRWYDVGHANGALGGKLIGAGGGGFLMFYAEDRKALRAAMAKEGLQEARFRFDREGSKVLVRD